MQGYGLGLAASAAAGINVGFTPSQVSMLLNYDSSVGTTTDEDGVNEWLDQGPNGYTLTQAVGAAKPDLSVARQNGLDGIFFDGIDDTFRIEAASPAIPTTEELTMFLVAELQDRYVTGTGSDACHVTHGVDIGTKWYTGPRIRPDDQDTSKDSVPPGGYAGTTAVFYAEANYVGGTVLRPHIFTFAASNDSTANDDAWMGEVNTHADYSAGFNAIFGADKIRIGEYNGGSSYWEGWIYQLIIYTAKLSAADVAATQSWLNTKWGVYA